MCVYGITHSINIFVHTVICAFFFGHFPMNPEICVLWVASDVLMCSASIWHMCTMSMDRYFTLKYPMRYGRNKTRRMVAGKILFVWVVSIAISSPVCIHGFIDTSSVFRNGDCVPKVKNFVIYGSVFAFYIPLLIMIVTYVLTIRILWKNQQRMKHIERSDLKPRLAQLTAQCTGFAIPKLLTNLKKPNKPGSASRVTLSRGRARKRALAQGSAAIIKAKLRGHENIASDADFSEDSVGGGRNNVGMVYLALPSPQTCTPGSTSPTSARLPLNSDTDESESDTNYFSLLETSHSCHSLCTPVSLTTSEKSLHRRLQKKHLFHQHQKELHLLHQECQEQRQLHHSSEGEAISSLSPPDDKPKDCLLRRHAYSMSLPTSPSSPLSPIFTEETHQPQQQRPLSDCSPVSQLLTTSSSAPKLYRKPSKAEETGKTASKKKRYSKRCKKRRNSLTQESPHTDRLEVPCPAYFARGRKTKKTSGHAVLTNAVSDSHVSQAGRCSKSENNNEQGVSRSYNNLSKDYKSLEWDRRYFQIQEEMDRCLKGEFGRWDRRHSKQEQTPNALLSKETADDTETDPETKTCVQPEISLPVSDPLKVNNNGAVFNGYSYSAPNSPLNRRNVDSVKANLSSDDDGEYELENEDNSDRTNDEEGNDTSGSSNSDIITIRLHPPTPKVTSFNQVENSSSRTFPVSSSSDNISACSNQTVTSLNVPASNHVTHRNTKTEHLNGVPHFSSSNNNNSFSSSLINGTSIHSLSPGSSSPLPELVISSEGEMTLEETDDTVEDSPKHQRVKLRRPNQLQSHYRFRMKPTCDPRGDKYVKPVRHSFRNTFRIHREKGAVKHILSKKTATNERKASKVLGIIFLVFVILWTPFFAVNIMNAACDTCMDNFNKDMMSLFLWMGYIASLANPIIYTMFNTAFRRTFIRILTCKIKRTRRTKSSDTHYLSYTTMLASERRNTMTVMLRDESR